eukprot:7596843-Alexandrium_andersonii.AAC.1
MVGSWTSDFRCQPLSKMTSSRRRGMALALPPAGQRTDEAAFALERPAAPEDQPVVLGDSQHFLHRSPMRLADVGHVLLHED